MPKDELLEEIGIPLTPVRLKCALLGLGVLKVALHRAKGTPLPEEWGTSSGEISLSSPGWRSRRSRSTSCPRRHAAHPRGRPDDRPLPVRWAAPRDRGPLHARRRASARASGIRPPAR